ncbi:unnamed protein product [Protopolystoma xenopodis]|uniref:Uncharacterized protein n=1 Tax=Protopolystoma xenopodis TaxID=117903 RepID=A0A448WXY1_9PLAT|nr:unnamed protein product [Protopolystoma xenopodis]
MPLNSTGFFDHGYLTQAVYNTNSQNSALAPVPVPVSTTDNITLDKPGSVSRLKSTSPNTAIGLLGNGLRSESSLILGQQGSHTDVRMKRLPC